MARLTPAHLGFRMPAEWEPHEATWLAWPHERTDWPGKFAPISWVYADVVRKLARFEKVRILIENPEAEDHARRVLKKAGANLNAVEFYHHATNRSWTRDFCPIFVRSDRGKVAVTDWVFNGWAKYSNWKDDNAVSAWIAEKLHLRRWDPGIVVEGGSIDVNGAGALLTTAECLLGQDVQVRNPGLARAALEKYFADYLGVEKTVWLNRGIAGDDTHGHIDDLARFTDARTIVTVIEPDKSDANHEPLQENLALLRRTNYRIATLPMPAPVWFHNQRLPASYANFYVANNQVLVPTFNDPCDRVALNTLAGLFPGREIVGIHSLDLVLGLGTLHCMTMQHPVGQISNLQGD